MTTTELLSRAEARCDPYEAKPLKVEVQTYVPPPATHERTVEAVNRHLAHYLKDSAAEIERVPIEGNAREALGWAILQVGKGIEYTPHAGRELKGIGEKIRKVGLAMIDAGRAGAKFPALPPSCPMAARLAELERRLTP